MTIYQEVMQTGSPLRTCGAFSRVEAGLSNQGHLPHAIEGCECEFNSRLRNLLIASKDAPRSSVYRSQTRTVDEREAEMISGWRIERSGLGLDWKPRGPPVAFFAF